MGRHHDIGRDPQKGSLPTPQCSCLLQPHHGQQGPTSQLGPCSCRISGKSCGKNRPARECQGNAEGLPGVVPEVLPRLGAMMVTGENTPHVKIYHRYITTATDDQGPRQRGFSRLKLKCFDKVYK